MFLLCVFFFLLVAVCTEGEVRLVEGTNPPQANASQGRVEVCLNHEWGTVCDDRWGNVDAGVVCSQLGFSRYSKWLIYLVLPFKNQSLPHNIIYADAMGVGFARFGQGSASMPIHLDEEACLGGERNLLECGRRPHDCTHYEDAGVICNETCK